MHTMKKSHLEAGRRPAGALLVTLGFVAGLITAGGLGAAVAQEERKEEAKQQKQAPVVVHRTKAPKRGAPNDKALVTLLARGEEAFLGLLEMEPQASVPSHRDPTEEYIYILQGRGTMVIDGVRHSVRPGTAIFMPAGAEVSFTNGDERLRAIQVFADPQPAGKYDAWKPR